MVFKLLELEVFIVELVITFEVAVVIRARQKRDPSLLLERLV